MVRRPLIFLVSSGLLLAALAVCFVALQLRQTMLRGVEDPLTASALPYRVPMLGVNAELTQYDDAALETQLGLMRQAGIRWVRQFIRWDEIEPIEGEFDWRETDRIIQAVADYPDIDLVVVLQNSPAWARDPQAAQDDPTGPPIDPHSFARFAQVFAERYGDRVSVYQIWDEPNLFSNWGRIRPRAIRYAELLQRAYTAIHAADQTATVLPAALAPTQETGPDNISELIFLRDLYALGAADYMDAVSVKSYGFDDGPDDRRVGPRLLNFSRVVQTRELMLEVGDGATAVWAGNWGWNTLPADWSGAPSIWGQVSAEQQADYVLAGLERAEREWPWMGPMILHQWQPDLPSDHPQWGFALLDPIGQPSSLLEALIARANSRPSAAIPGWHAPRSPYAAYSGVWTFDDQQRAADIGWLRDSRLSFTFAGQDIGLLLRKDNVLATLYPTLDDGVHPNAVPVDGSGRGFITLTSATLTAQSGPVAVARASSNGTHVLQVIADQGFDRYALQGFAVGAGDISAPYHGLVNGALLAVIGSLGALIYSSRQVDWKPLLNRLAWLWMRVSAPVQWSIGIVTSLILMAGMLLTWGQDPPVLIRRESAAGVLALVSAGLVYLNPLVPITLLSALVLFWVIYHRPVMGLGLTLLYAPFFLFPIELWRFSLPMSELVLLISAAAWAARLLVDWAGRYRAGETVQLPSLSTIDKLVFAYAMLGLAALSWSSVQSAALTEFRTLFVEPTFFYVIWRTTVKTARDRQTLVFALIAAGTLAAGISLFQYTRGEGIITAEDLSQRLAGVYGSPNNLALFLGRCIPFVLAFLLITKRTGLRIASSGSLILMLSAAALTQSVGGLFIGIPAAVVTVILVLVGRRSLPWLIGAIVLGILAFSMLGATSERFSRALDFNQGTNFYRVRVMQSAIQMIGDHPLTGLGLDQFLYAFRDRYLYPDAWQEPNLSHPHNFLLDFWVRLGLLGVPLVLGFIWAMLRAFRRGMSVNRWQAAAGLGALASTFTHGLLDNSVFVVDLILVFMMLAALAQSLDHERGQAITTAQSDMVD